MWTKNFQMFKLDLEKEKGPEIKSPTSVDYRKSKRVQEKYLLYWLCQAFDNVDHNNLGKILQEMGIPDHLTCLLRNLYAGQNQQLELGMEQ